MSIRREEMAHAAIAGQLSQVQAARVYGVSAKIVSRWTGRFLAVEVPVSFVHSNILCPADRGYST